MRKPARPARLHRSRLILRQDVGLTLRVRPQVSDNGIVKMQIYQEVSSIYNQNFASGIILNKRNIESNVLVDDG